jgi:hypothetical protein
MGVAALRNRLRGWKQVALDAIPEFLAMSRPSKASRVFTRLAQLLSLSHWNRGFSRFRIRQARPATPSGPPPRSGGHAQASTPDS